MAQQDDGQEKTLEPTPQRIERARQEGDVPRSLDANTAAAYLALWVTLLVAGGTIAYDAAAPLSVFLRAPGELAERMLGGGGGGEQSSEIILEAVLGAAPLLLAPMAAVVVSLLAQRAIVASSKKIEPKLSNISPISNAAQKFGPTGLVEFLKSFVKLCALSTVIIVLFLSYQDGVSGLMALDARMLPGLMQDQAILLLGAATGIAIAIGAIDLAWQRYDHRRRLKMSVQELKEELKRSEGDPYLKQARQQRARKIATNQMLNDVPSADVVIVNPTHYAVALKWSRKPGAAPECVAKGVDEIARRIREIAVENGVPIHSDPPTARALHATVEIGDEIPEEQYQAVAAAIRFADGLRGRMRAARGASGGDA